MDRRTLATRLVRLKTDIQNALTEMKKLKRNLLAKQKGRTSHQELSELEQSIRIKQEEYTRLIADYDQLKKELKLKPNSTDNQLSEAACQKISQAITTLSVEEQDRLCKNGKYLIKLNTETNEVTIIDKNNKQQALAALQDSELMFSAHTAIIDGEKTLWIPLEKMGQGAQGRVKKLKSLLENKYKVIKISNPTKKKDSNLNDLLIKLGFTISDTEDNTDGTHKKRTIMPLAKGIELYTYLFYKENNEYFRRPISSEEKLMIAIGMCEEVDRLHKKNILHRDLKPENFMCHYDKETKQITITLVDFDMAVKLPEGQLCITQQSAMGTQGFIAPEILNGQLLQRAQKLSASTYSKGSDIYALGVCFTDLQYDQYNNTAMLDSNPQNRPTAHKVLCDLYTKYLENKRKPTFSDKNNQDNIRLVQYTVKKILLLLETDVTDNTENIKQLTDILNKITSSTTKDELRDFYATISTIAKSIDATCTTGLELAQKTALPHAKAPNKLSIQIDATCTTGLELAQKTALPHAKAPNKLSIQIDSLIDKLQTLLSKVKLMQKHMQPISSLKKLLSHKENKTGTETTLQTGLTLSNRSKSIVKKLTTLMSQIGKRLSSQDHSEKHEGRRPN